MMILITQHETIVTTPALELEDESQIRVTARAAENFLGPDHELTVELRGIAVNATKVYGEGEHQEYTSLDGEAALLAVAALKHMYDGLPHFSWRAESKLMQAPWHYGDRLAAADVLGLDPPARESDRLMVTELPLEKPEFAQIDVDEDRPFYDAPHTWVTGMLDKLGIARLISSDR